MHRKALRIAISAFAIILVTVRFIWPNLPIDHVTLGLVILAILPWITSLIESAELPGGIKIKFKDIEEAVKTAENIDIDKTDTTVERPLSYLDVFPQDPNLAMVALRIEIENKLRELARLSGIKEQYPLRKLFDALLKARVLDFSSINSFHEIISVGNRAAHGAKIDPNVSSWVYENADKFLYFIDRIINQKKKMV